VGISLAEGGDLALGAAVSEAPHYNIGTWRPMGIRGLGLYIKQNLLFVYIYFSRAVWLLSTGKLWGSL